MYVLVCESASGWGSHVPVLAALRTWNARPATGRTEHLRLLAARNHTVYVYLVFTKGLSS